MSSISARLDAGITLVVLVPVFVAEMVEDVKLIHATIVSINIVMIRATLALFLFT